MSHKVTFLILCFVFWVMNPKTLCASVLGYAEVIDVEPVIRKVRALKKNQNCNEPNRGCKYTKTAVEVVDGYWVTYRYKGKVYTTMTLERPGRLFPVEVEVDPL